MKRLGLLAGCLTIYGAPLVAQAPVASADSAPNACPVLNGIRIGADWGDSSTTSRADSNRRGSFRLGGGTTIDTTLTFDVTHQTWSRTSCMAYTVSCTSRSISLP
jgi:hypothetical protein